MISTPKHGSSFTYITITLSSKKLTDIFPLPEKTSYKISVQGKEPFGRPKPTQVLLEIRISEILVTVYNYHIMLHIAKP